MAARAGLARATGSDRPSAVSQLLVAADGLRRHLGVRTSRSETRPCPHVAFSLHLPPYEDPSPAGYGPPYSLQCDLIFASSIRCDASGST